VIEILSQFDPESVTAEDAKAINEAFRAEGIRPSAEVKSLTEAAGFDVEALRSPEGPKGTEGRPPPPPPSEDEDAISTLLSIHEGYENETLDEVSLVEIMAKFQEAEFSMRDSFLNIDV